MKRLLLAGVVAAAALTAILGYASNRRELTYRRLIEQGNAGLAQGDSFEAIEAFTVAIALKPDSMLGYLKRGEAYRQYAHRSEPPLARGEVRADELETSLKDLRMASRLDSSATRPLELLGDVEHELRRYDRAAARYEQYVRIDDRSPRVLYKLALAKYDAGNTNGAVDALRDAVAIDERFAEAHYLLGLCLHSLRKPDQARASFQRAVMLAPGLLDAREELAELHRRTSRAQDRISELQALVALDPGAPRHVALGLAHADAGHFDNAVITLGSAAESFPTYTYTYVALGRVWLEVAETRRDPVALRKAVEALERGAASEGSSEALTLFGKALLMSSDVERAESALLEATSKRPVDPRAFSYLAEAAERTGNVQIAREALLDYRALEGDPPDSRDQTALFQRIADLSARLGEHAVAVRWFQRAVSVASGDADAALLVRLADAQWRSGDPASARETVARALDKEPANRAARALLRRLR